MVSFSCVCDTIFVCPTCVCETINVWAVNRLTNDTCSSFFPFSLAGAGAGLKTALHRLTASSHCKLDLHRLTASSHKRKCKLELHRLTNASRTIVSQTQVQLELLSHTRWRVHRRRSQDRRCLCPVYSFFYSRSEPRPPLRVLTANSHTVESISHAGDKLHLDFRNVRAADGQVWTKGIAAHHGRKGSRI